MKTSCISHPPNAPLIVIHQWQVDMMNGNTTAAKLMSFFEYWHNVKLGMAIDENGFVDRRELIQHHSEPELEYGLLVDTTRKSIRLALKQLYAAGVVSLEQNPYNPHDRTRHFLFHPNKAQNLANRWNEVYLRHREEFGCKNPVCIPENLNRTALGQNADCNRSKCLVEEADLPTPSGQNASSIRPNGLDPKTTSKTSTKTSTKTNTPLPPQGELPLGLPGKDPEETAKASTSARRSSQKESKDVLDRANPEEIQWAELTTERIFPGWREHVFWTSRPGDACGRKNFLRSLLEAVIEDGYDKTDLVKGFELWIEQGKLATQQGRRLFGVPNPERAARKNRKDGTDAKWVGYLEAYRESDFEFSDAFLKDLKNQIASQLKRLGRSAVLPPSWQSQTAKQTVGELTPQEMQAYLLELQSEGVRA